jgi:uncharacterized protein
MDGSFLCFCVHENPRAQPGLLWPWLLQEADKLGTRGSSAFRALASFGRHHALHEDHFFELAGTLTAEGDFIVIGEETRHPIDLVQREKERSFCARIPARFGVIDPAPGDPNGCGEAASGGAS